MFDRWLRTTLRQNYDQALEEPLPEELTNLLLETEGDQREH